MSLIHLELIEMSRRRFLRKNQASPGQLLGSFWKKLVNFDFFSIHINGFKVLKLLTILWLN